MTRRALAGLALWVGLGVAVGSFALSPSGRPITERLARYVGESPRRLRVVLPAGTVVRRFDPVLRPARDHGFLEKCGWVERAEVSADETVAVVALYPEHADLMRDGSLASLFNVPDTAGWIAKTLVPRERIEEIAREWAAFWVRERESIFEALRPQLLAAVGDLLVFFQREIPTVLARHSDEWAALLERHRAGAFEQALVPALREVGVAHARERFEPLVKEVGGELWKALPLWDLGVRAMWERVPLTADEQVERRFGEFLRADAAPILERHADAFLDAARAVIEASLDDPRVREALAAVVRDVTHDEALLALLRAHLDELVLENESLQQILLDRWQSEPMQTALVAIGERLEPLFKDVVNSIVLAGDRQTINPRLAMVLRARVLRKDARWIVLTPGGGAEIADDARLVATTSE